jgi:uncharacterized protein (TIGR02246 family)
MAEDLDELKSEIRRLGDIEAISQVKARYCGCVDGKDWAGYADLVTEDFELATDGGTIKGRDQVLASLGRSLAQAMTVHHVHTPEITFTGPDSASVIWAMNDYVILPGKDDPFVIRGYGHYHEDYVRDGDRWRMKRSELRRLRVDTEGELAPNFAASS